MPLPRTLLIGVGNAYRRDDGVGLVVAQRLRTQRLPDCDVRESDGEGVALMEAWRHGAERVILIDAVSSTEASGTLHRFDAAVSPIPAAFFRYSTHVFSVAEAVEMARALGCLPHALIVYGVEGAEFSAGRGLSPAVEQAVPLVVQQITQDLCDA